MGVWLVRYVDHPFFVEAGIRANVIQFVNTVGGVGALDQSANLLSFPASKYDNLRAGMPNN
jgi:chitinase